MHFSPKDLRSPNFQDEGLTFDNCDCVTISVFFAVKERIII